MSHLPPLSARVLALAAVLLSFSTAAHAQSAAARRAPSGAELTASFEWLPPVDLTAKAATALGNAVRMRTTRATGRLALPRLRLGGRSSLQVDLAYDRLETTYDGTTVPAPAGPGVLHTAQVGLTFTQRLSPAWSLALLSQTALVTDGREIDRSHLRQTGGIFAIRTVRPTLQYGFGAVTIGTLDYPLPAFRLAWIDGRRQRLILLAPAFGEYAHALGGGVEAGLTFRFSGNRYATGSAATAPFDRVDVLQFTTGAFLGLRLGNVATMTFEGGYAPFREVRQFEAGRKDTTERLLDPKTGGYLRATLRTRL